MSKVIESVEAREEEATEGVEDGGRGKNGDEGNLKGKRTE